MPPAKPRTPQLEKLQQRHGDARLHQKKSRSFSQNRLPTVGKVVAHVQSGASFSQGGGTFQSTATSLTPAGSREVFRKLYAFFFFEMTLFMIWTAFRFFVRGTPVWFDEGVVKAIVFGVPVFWIAAKSPFVAKTIGLEIHQLIPGLFLGIALGGLYGFAGVLAQVVGGGVRVAAAPLYLAPEFWSMAFVALLTSWWESLFFFGLPNAYLRSVAPWLSETVVGVFIVALYLLFHAPLRVIIAGVSPQFVVQMGVLSLFVIGQFLFYNRTKNMYAIVLSTLFWGLVIEIYSR